MVWMVGDPSPRRLCELWRVQEITIRRRVRKSNITHEEEIEKIPQGQWKKMYRKESRCFYCRTHAGATKLPGGKQASFSLFLGCLFGP
jgi:hypothetical protein